MTTVNYESLFNGVKINADFTFHSAFLREKFPNCTQLYVNVHKMYTTNIKRF